MKNQIKIMTLLGLGFCFGLAAVVTNYTATTTQRNPASNEMVHQITDLSAPELKLLLQHRIHVHPTVEGKKSISLNGISSSICSQYSKIELDFVAEGISVAGEPPVLKISFPCQAGQNPAELAPARLAIGRLLAEKPHNAEFLFDGFTTSLTLHNSADEWPTTWVMSGAHFKNENGNNKDVSFDRGPASATEHAPIVLEF